MLSKPSFKNFSSVVLRGSQMRKMSLKRTNVLIYGDSNTWGYNPDCSKVRNPSGRIPYEDRWTTHCQQSLGQGFNIISDGLNGRTTVFSDLSHPPCDGDYDCNGRITLPTVLHTHKPLHIVVLALGANDLKSKFGASSRDIVAGIRVLVRDVQKCQNIGYVKEESNQEMIVNPKILVLSPPIIKSTPMNRLWGFDDDVEAKSRRLLSLLSVVTKELGVDYLNIGPNVGVSTVDGVHIPFNDQPILAKLMTDKLLEMKTKYNL